MDFNNKEISIVQNLSKNNRNKNLKFISKNTKFGPLKYNERNNNKNKVFSLNKNNKNCNNLNNINIEIENKEYNITKKWLEYSNNNC